MTILTLANNKKELIVSHAFLIDKPISIYVHWPFCLAKCPYCDFNSHVSKKQIDHDKWLNAYIKQLEYFYKFIKGRRLVSIYFGGGTPSLMDPAVVNVIIKWIKNNTIWDDQLEITLETNPTSFNHNKFLAFKDAGVNRISIGVQSLNSKHLNFLGREHSVQMAIEAIHSASEIFARYSFDLIYALPNQTLESWGSELESALQITKNLNHISLYQLTIEKGTKFFTMHRDKEFTMPSEDLASSFYTLTNKILSDHGMHSYEISNYATCSNHFSKHNLCYWQYDDYLGIGPGAHGRLRQDFMKHLAFNNIYNPDVWMESVFNDSHCGIQKLDYIWSQKEITTEIILMGMRIKNGISHERAIEKLGSRLDQLIDKNMINYLLDNGFLVIDNECMKLTETGLIVSDYIVRRLVQSIICI